MEEFLAYQQWYLDYTVAPDVIACEEDPVAARRLLTTDPNYLPVGACATYMPKLFRERFPSLPLGFNGGPLLFAHGLRQSNGQVRLVTVGLTSVGDAEDLRADITVPASNRQPQPGMPSQSELVISRSIGQHFTFLAGQIDSSDSSHFTLAYRLDGQPGTIDGYLTASGTVKMQVRDGPAQTLVTSEQALPFRFRWGNAPTTAPTPPRRRR